MKRWKDGFIAWDVETTGLKQDARIVEIGTALFSFGSEIACASSMFDPGLTAEQWNDEGVQEALRANGIDRSDCLRSWQIQHTDSGVERLFVYQDTSILTRRFEVYAGHNVRFDLRMLAQERQRALAAGVAFFTQLAVLEQVRTSKHLCTMGLDLALRPDSGGRHNLAATCERWGVEHGDMHRALADAKAVGRLLWRMSSELPDDLDEVLALQDRALDKFSAERDHR